MSSINTETETVVKKILPYLERRGYDIVNDLDFETGVSITERYSKGYIDILVHAGKAKPLFLIEAKKISKTLTTKDRDQAIAYAKSSEINVPFVVVTNGVQIQCFNVRTKNRILWDGKPDDKIPSKDQIKKVSLALKTNPNESVIKISNDDSLPFRPGLALRQLNALFYKCHSAIRKIEKNEESAFSDFSKLLFLKLLEEKADVEDDFKLPYSYRFHELAEKPSGEADQVKTAILSMITGIVKERSYGEVLENPLLLKNPKTFQYVVKELAAVSFYDCSLDSKGAAFEYFVRATLKGKKLGQYFTPRELVQTMLAIVGQKKIVTSVITGTPIKVLDPACGTGGFLVFLMQDSLNQLKKLLDAKDITKAAYDNAKSLIKERIFFGSDANEGVAASAKMNMIIAGDGHTNIQNEDSLSSAAKNWSVDVPNCDLILTNPPFGTSESDSLAKADRAQFPIWSGKGQYLFIQKMVLSLIPDTGELCTVIDEGVLNTESAGDLRRWLMQQCRLKAVFNLPGETFKPNKINVRSSLLYFERREKPDLDFEDNYKVTICQIQSLGYIGSGDKIRGYDIDKFLREISKDVFDTAKSNHRKGYNWEAFDIESSTIVKDTGCRFDYKYWNSDTRSRIAEIRAKGGRLIAEMNMKETSRGKSPAAENYVDEKDGFAIVIKSGSNVSKQGTIVTTDADWIEKSVYDEFLIQPSNKNIIQKYDVLLSSTGDGTLGKCAVYELDTPAIADGHVTIIRVNPDLIDPYYLCDYLRAGFGAVQINRLYTGSTGMIELTPDQVNSIVVDMRSGVDEQKKLSFEVRALETKYLEMLHEADGINQQSASVLNL
ncbi:N-6 DNA methylase [Pseudomonas sp. CCC3.2]|uniref:N-6 DNA methylase n=1 Tax=unclassified Pseudomonas TaxID=196821 RepID=UPI002AB5B862|nr:MULTISPECIES: N-6 DNA methylase [unclassified Pseudomonas]MDY7562418.1 N-6 DNA methylase [Pseudomonas sp. AB6]MEB0180284.1 N-6 DNA methylase [Pseudomonas sp. CCC3.2]MEB0212375.1 N-6 DNA methylase [Pseudomonas sp. AB6]